MDFGSHLYGYPYFVHEKDLTRIIVILFFIYILKVSSSARLGKFCASLLSYGFKYADGRSEVSPLTPYFA